LKPVLATIVLYKMPFSSSPAFGALQTELRRRPDLAAKIDLLVVDNTPQAQSVPADFTGQYLHDGANPGLAERYNHALARAAEAGTAWLMLLDQDTTVTTEYLEEVCHTTAAVQEHGAVCSPAEAPVLGAPRAVARDTVGVSERRLFPFNSGAVLRVSAMRLLGGFPAEFPLDYLDHATFAALQAQGGRIQVLRSVLAHQLSSNTAHRNVDAAAARRQAAVLEAEHRFYGRYGTPAQRWLRRLRLLKAVAGRLLRGKEAGQTWRMLKSALRP
jgi:GT2 family glycosyltransferase